MLKKAKAMAGKALFAFFTEYIFLILPYILMDVFIRIKANKIDYNRKGVLVASILFSVVFTIFIVVISKWAGGRKGRIIYSVITVLYFIVFIANIVYFVLTGYFFKMSLVFMASEGGAYILDTITGAGLLSYIMIGSVLASIIFAIYRYKEDVVVFTKKRCIIGAVVFAIFIASQFAIPCVLEKANEGLKWDNWRRAANVYKEFADSNKNMKICGLFKYTERDIEKTFFKKKEKMTEEEKKFLDDIYNQKQTHASNEYTGIFKGKNVIFLQLEGMDSWLLTKEDTPTLYGLMNEGVSFTEHYSYYNGGGSTFNSEFAVNTGFITPISYNRNAYTFSTNEFRGTLPVLFREQGYSTDAYHKNTGEYYSRGLNYKSWGYDAYHGLVDEFDYDESDLAFELDTELFNNKEYSKDFFKKDGLFLNYLITFTPHTPFSTEKSVGQYLGDKVYGKGKAPNLSEEEVARLMVKETDDMVAMLVQGLKDNGLYDNTVIVAYADHYLYTINDKSVLDKYKETSDNRINNTPMFIWSADFNGKDLAGKQIDKVNSQLDILPTVLNLFGISFEDDQYIGHDIFDSSYRGYVFFDDYSWYDGQMHTNDTDETISKLIKQNDLTLKYNYFSIK